MLHASGLFRSHPFVSTPSRGCLTKKPRQIADKARNLRRVIALGAKIQGLPIEIFRPAVNPGDHAIEFLTRDGSLAHNIDDAQVSRTKDRRAQRLGTSDVRRLIRLSQPFVAITWELWNAMIQSSGSPKKPSAMKSSSTIAQSRARNASMSRSTSMVQIAEQSGSCGKGLIIVPIRSSVGRGRDSNNHFVPRRS